MAEIPLRKYCEIEFPMTPKSTVHFWATQGYYHRRGPLAGKVKRIGGRYYIKISSDDVVVDEILNNVEALIRRGEQNEI